MTTVRNQCYVVSTADEIPIHLKDRSPFILKDTEMTLRFPRGEVFGSGGRVKMDGAIEFQSKISPGTLSDICDPDELYTAEMVEAHRFRCVYDPELQRGVKDTPKGPREYLREKQIEDMMRDIEEGRFECPHLMWNLRAGQTIWAYINDARELRIYQGVATRPDTNHRHHAIIRFHRRYQRWVAQTGSEEMGTYTPTRQYGLVVYTDDYEGEAHRSYVYNALGWKVSGSTASYLESKTQSPNVHVKLARELMERSPILGHENVEILKNNLHRNSAKMVTFQTLSNGIREAFAEIPEDQYKDVLEQLVRFVGAMHRIRPNEIGLLDLSRRKRARERSLSDSPPLWSAYFRLAERIFAGKFPGWEEKLNLFNNEYSNGTFRGDFFSLQNPAWEKHNVVALGPKGPQVRNNPQARRGAYELVCELFGFAQPSVSTKEAPARAPIAPEESDLQRRLTKAPAAVGATMQEKPAPSNGDIGIKPQAPTPAKVPSPVKPPVNGSPVGNGTTNKPGPEQPPRERPNNRFPDESSKSLERRHPLAPVAVNK